jgi:organic hydroperoxide reductase OsmC/OhrA
MEEASEMSFVYAKEDFPREKSCEENMKNPESMLACAASSCYNKYIKERERKRDVRERQILCVRFWVARPVP